MPKGRSYAADPWDSYDKGSHSFAQDDFVHDKTFVFKAKLEKPNDGINIKESINEKAEGLSSTGEVKFWCNVHDNRSFYAKVGSASNMHFLYDNGVRELKDVSTNWFAGIETNRNFTERVINLGLELFQKKDWAFGCRWRYNHAKKSHQIDNKGSWSWKNWRVNGFHTVDITNKLLVKSGVLIAKHHSEEDKCKCDWFVQLEGARQADKVSLSQVIDRVIFSCTEQVSKTQKVGVEVGIFSFRPLCRVRTSVDSCATHGKVSTPSG